MKRIFFLLLLLTLLATAPTRASAAAAASDTQNYHRAFSELAAGHPDIALTYSAHGRDSILNKVLLTYYMAQPGNDISFSDLAAFINDNPGWPNLLGIVAIAEQKLPETMPAIKIIDWFTNHPPETFVGFVRYIDALDASGSTAVAVRLVNSHWVETDFSHDDMQNFYARYGDQLSSETHWARLDRLLWKEDASTARTMYPFVTSDQRAIAETRLALAARSAQAQNLLSDMPSAGHRDPGLQWELLKWDIATKSDQNAVQILLGATGNLVRPGAWWEPRQTMIRRMIERQDYATAYRLASENGQTDGKNLLQAEFLAGWLALRFLGQPEDAEKHFKAFMDNATTPVSRSRGSYWLGRTYEVLQEKEKAEQFYEDAAAFNTTYYGQLAATRLYANPTIEIKAEPPIPAKVRAQFNNNSMVEAVQHLSAIGERDRAHSFFKAAIDMADERVEFVLLSDLAYQIHRPDMAINAAKVANQKNFVMGASGFPMLRIPMPPQPEPAFTNALIRQESMFNPEAGSPVGATGLMQLMPNTARAVANKLNIKFKSNLMTDPAYNIRLGSAYLQQLITHYDGSYIMALAAYNAGPGRLNEWIEAYGDPRSTNIDAVDWVELIPLSETRNYVQRIIENLQAYRARENGGTASLLILNDLRR